MLNSRRDELEKFAKVHTSASIRNFHDRQDVLQDVRIVFILLEKKYKDLTDEEFVKLARTACRNRVRDYIRTKQRKLELGVPGVAQIDVSRIDSREVLKEIKRAVPSRVSTILQFMEAGLESADVQQVFSISRMQLSRILKQARKSVNKEVIDAVRHRSYEEGSGTRITDSTFGFGEEGREDILGSIQLCYNEDFADSSSR